MSWFDFAILIAALMLAVELLKGRRKPMGMCRAEIEWLSADAMKRVGCLRIGDADFDHQRFDDFERACTVIDLEGVLEIKGWDDPRNDPHDETSGISPEQWLAMERCILREGITRYKFSRARGERGSKTLHWCRRRWDEQNSKWIKDSARWPGFTGISSPPPEGHSGVHAMPQTETAAAVDEVTPTPTAEAPAGDEPSVVDLDGFDVRVCEPRDVANDDRLEIHVVRYFKGKKRPGFWLTSGWDGSEKAIDGIQAFLGLNVGEAFKQMQQAKDAAKA